LFSLPIIFGTEGFVNSLFLCAVYKEITAGGGVRYWTLRDMGIVSTPARESERPHKKLMFLLHSSSQPDYSIVP
jgi:hypothetical protein